MSSSALPEQEEQVYLHLEQARFLQSRALFKGFVGGRGAGKTWIGAQDLLARSLPDRTYLIASPTSVLMMDTTFPTFKAQARAMGVWDPDAVVVSPYPTAVLTTGATIRFRTAEDPERMRGPNLTGVWLDEASLMHEDAYRVSIAALREAGEQGWLSATFTPKGLTHWTYAVFGGSPPRPDTEIFTCPTAANPFLPPAFADTLSHQYAGQFARQELGGEFVAMEGAEWPGDYFDRVLFRPGDWPDNLVVKAMALDPSKGKEKHAIKEGRLPDYSAFVWGGLDGNGILWVDADLDQSRDATRIVEDGIAHFRRFNPAAFSVEVNQFQSLLAHDFIRRSRELRLPLPLYGITNTEQKELRIRQVGPYLARRELRFADTPGGRLLVAQLRDFPAGAYDDGPDALQMLLVTIRYMLGQADHGPAQPRPFRG